MFPYIVYCLELLALSYVKMMYISIIAVFWDCFLFCFFKFNIIFHI